MLDSRDEHGKLEGCKPGFFRCFRTGGPLILALLLFFVALLLLYTVLMFLDSRRFASMQDVPSGEDGDPASVCILSHCPLQLIFLKQGFPSVSPANLTMVRSGRGDGDTNAIWTDREQVLLAGFLGMACLLFFCAVMLLMRRSMGKSEQYRYILDQVHDGVYLFDEERYRFCFANKSGLNQVGYSLSSLKRLTPEDIKPEFSLAELRKRFAPLVVGDQHIVSFETVLLTKRGSLLPVDVLVKYLHMKDGGYFLAVIRDVTEKRRAMVEKDLLEKKLREAQRLESIATLAGGIAHDFNNILTSIMGYTELAILQLGKDDPVARDLQVVLDAGNRARELVRQILTFSRQRPGRKKPLKVQMLAKEALKMLEAASPASITIHQEINDESGGVILADPVQIHQLIMNLCINAINAMEQEGGTLTVAISGVRIEEEANSEGVPPGRYVLIRVIDTGPGIEPEILDRIFEPYFTTREKEKGTGLGLAVVHGIVHGHGGHITVKSEPGKGTEFQVYFPEERREVPAVSPSEEKDSLGPYGRGENILVVDDEEPLVRLLERTLDRMGFSVQGFTATDKVLQVVKQQRPEVDLLIVDYDMPGMNGLELVREMRKLYPELPVILCTGYEDRVRKLDWQQVGINEVLQKPVTSRELADVLRRIFTSASS